MKEVTDPNLLAQLNGKEVTDPALLAQLNGDQPKDPRSLTERMMSPFAAFASGVNRGALTMLPGIAGDTAANIMDLGIAGYGTAKRAIGGAGTEMPDPVDRARLPLTSAWFQSLLNKTELGRKATEPNREYPGLSSAGQAVGASLAPGSTPAGLGVAAASGLVGQKAAQAAPLVGLPSNETAIAASLATPLAFGAGRVPSTRTPSKVEQTLKAGQSEGMVVAPAEVGPSFLEGIGGKIKTQQVASQRNQEVVNRLAAEYLGLPPKTNITQPVLEEIRANAGQVYSQLSKQKAPIVDDVQYLQEVLDLSKSADRLRIDFPAAQLPAQEKIGALSNGLLPKKGGFSAEGAVQLLKQLRSEARSNYASNERSPDPEKLALAKAQEQGAKSLESLIERNLVAQGQGDLMQKFRDARATIAKTHTVEAALNEATGNVSARKLGKSDYVTGPLRSAADFAKAFPKSNQVIENIGGVPSVSPLDLYGTVGAAGLGNLALGPGGGLLASGIPLLRNAAVPLALSARNQRGLLGGQPPPDYGILPLTMPAMMQGGQ